MMYMKKTKWVTGIVGLLLVNSFLLTGCQSSQTDSSNVKQTAHKESLQFVPIKIDGQAINSLNDWKNLADKQGLATPSISKEDEVPFIFNQLIYQTNKKVIDTSEIASDKSVNNASIIIPYVVDKSIAKYLDNTYRKKVDENPTYYSHDGYLVGVASLDDSKSNQEKLTKEMSKIKSKKDYLALNSQDTHFTQFLDFVNLGNSDSYDQPTIRFLEDLEGESSGKPVKLTETELKKYPRLNKIIQSQSELNKENPVFYIQHVESGMVNPNTGRIMQELALYHQDTDKQDINQNLVNMLKTIVESNKSIEVPNSFYTDYLLPKMKENQKGTESLKDYPDSILKSLYPYCIQ